MLYERWRQIARERPSETALSEFPSGRCWTFAELAAGVEKLPATTEPLVHAQGHAAEFIFTVLRAWRDRAVLCPLETSQPRPGLPAPPPPVCHLKLTSATTGPARAVGFTAGQLAADADHIVATMGLRPDWPNLGVISLAHSYGFSNLVLPLLLHGIPLVLVTAPLPEIVRRAAGRLPELTLAGAPALWRTWLEAGAIPPQTRLAISAGAPLSLALEREIFQTCGLKIHNFYGSSECGGIACDVTETLREDEACVGAPVRNVTLDLDSTGCLRVTSRAAGTGYWPVADPALGAGVFQTSDLAELRDGLVFLRGRLCDQINVAGRKIHPAVIEQLLAAHPAVRDCVVFGVPDPCAERNETITAGVVLRGSIPVARLRQYLLSHLPAWQVPRDWFFVEELGANERGKRSRAECRRKFLARE